jgi:hypothetical protein
MTSKLRHVRPLRRPALTAILTAAALAAPATAATITSGTTTIIAETTTAAPDGNGTFSQFAAPVLNIEGRVAFQGSLNGTSGVSSDNIGIFRGDGSTLTEIARKGQAAPDNNGVLSFLGPPAMTNTGQVAFNGRLTGTSGGSSNVAVSLLGNGVTLTQIVREGQTAPDSSGDFMSFSDPAINDNGQTAFVGYFPNPSGQPWDNGGIFRSGESTLVQIARTGRAAPDGNGSFSFFPSVVSLNDAGQVAFRSELANTSRGTGDNVGIFFGDGSTVTQVARSGSAAPDENGIFVNFGSASINDTGQVAFSAILTNTSGGSDDNTGIYYGDGATLTQVARGGSAAPDGNGSFFRFDNASTNDAGQVAFSASLTNTSGGLSDNRGIFRSDNSTLTQIAREGQSAPTRGGSFKGVLSELLEPAVNNSGHLAFLGEIDLQNGGATDDELGLFFYDDAIGLRAAARTGDSIDGSTIVRLVLSTSSNQPNGRSGLNDVGQIAYLYFLADGRQGIAITTLDSAIAGDANFDGAVDLADFGLLRAGFGSMGDLTRLDGDFNKDGVVDLADFGLLRANFGSSVAAADLAAADAWAATVPEPGLPLVSLSLMSLAARRRR